MRCSVTIRNKGEQKIDVLHSDGNITLYTDSKCHPRFVQKYSTRQKFFGGVGHIVTMGIGLIVAQTKDKESWPGFTNSDEICIKCKNSPGSAGCSKIGTEIIGPKGETLNVNHSQIL